MATHTSETLTSGAGGTALLPRSVANDIWKEATAQAVVPTLAKAHPIILGDNIIPVLTKRPSASIVGELGNKPDSELEVGAKSIKPIKAVVGLEFSMETIEQNPSNVLDLMSAELAQALARQIDLAVLHGRQASDGQPLSGDPDYINKTTNRITLTADPADADLALWNGYDMVVGGDKPHNFTGFGFDPRFTSKLANARDEQGRRLNPDINMGQGVSTYAGQSVVVSRSISGQMDASTDTGVRAFGGDWEQLRFGRALDISLKRIEYGDPFGNGDLQRRNAVAFLTEVIFGWGIMDLGAFVAFDNPVGANPTTTTTTGLTITNEATLPSRPHADAYGYSFAATGGTGTYTWALDTGSTLPTGLTLSAAGRLAGTAAAGTYTFTVKVTDSTTPTPLTGSKAFSLTLS